MNASPVPPPRLVLVRPRTPGNVGAVARAMKNFGLADLRLVDPRLHREQDSPGEEPVFEREARLMAWGASDVLESARTSGTLDEAVADCTLVLATAPKPAPRMECVSPEEGASRLAGPGGGRALVFGSESSGLTREELARCAAVVVIPTEPVHRDLNLAQSAVLMAYLIYRARAQVRSPSRAAAAEHREVEAAADSLLEAARGADFIKFGGEGVARELRALLHRAGLTSREAGLVNSLGVRLAHRVRRRSTEG